MKIERKDGKTIIRSGNVKLITDAINRHRYNDLRKKRHIRMEHVISIIKKSKKKNNPLKGGDSQ